MTIQSDTWFAIETKRGRINVPVVDSVGITVDYSCNPNFPYCYYDDNTGETSANNPAFWYTMGMLKPNYPVPALIQDSQSNLGLRWSNWLDNDRLSGRKY